MRTRPAWLSYAAEIKAKVDELPRTKKAAARRDQFVYASYLDVKERFGYVGTLGEWEFVISETKSIPRRRAPQKS